MNQVDLLLLAPAQDVAAGQFRAIVASDNFGSSSLLDDALERACHAAAAQAAVDFELEAFAGERVHYGENTDAATGADRIGHEVKRHEPTLRFHGNCWRGDEYSVGGKSSE